MSTFWHFMEKAVTVLLALTIVLAVMPVGAFGKTQASDFTDTAPSTVSDGRLKSTLSSLLSDGYVADVVNGNIENWLLEALDKNPGIIERIRNHDVGNVFRLGAFINDGWGMTTSRNVYALTMKEAGAFGPSVQWKHKTAGDYFDIDLAFSRQNRTTTNWSGASYLWIYADVSGFGTDSVPLGFAFEETDTDGSGALNGTREAWGLKVGGNVTLYPTGGTAVETPIVTSATPFTDNSGRIPLPAGFTGWVRVKLDSNTLFTYWGYPTGANNGTLNLADVHQFMINVEGTASSVNGTACLGPFMLSGDVHEAPKALDDTIFTNVWDLRFVQNGEYDFFWDEAVYAFYGEFPGKLMTGMAFSYLLSPSEELKAAGDELAAALAQVQGPDGYLGIFDGAQRFGGGGANWDVWCHYHDIYGLYQWYLATGNASALDTALKAADCMVNHFTGRSYASAGTPMCNLAISHVYALLYQETGKQAYLDHAISIVENEWASCGNWLNNIETMDFYEMGNNYGNRWETFHTIMTLGALSEITGEERYADALEKLWYSIIKTDRHNSGSFSVGEGACGDSFRDDGIETCCSIAWMALTNEYLQTSRNALAADELELSFYNTMLGSLTEGNRNVTYNTPMNGSLITAQEQLAFQTRPTSPDFCCCQANSSRGLAQLSQWAVMNDETGLYWNYYGESAAKVKTPGGQNIVLTQKSAYPTNGHAKITVSGLGSAEKFTIWFRVPSWALSYQVAVNGKTFSTDKTGVYLPITGTWSNGDEITVDIGMSLHFWKGSSVQSDRVSLYYGPVLFAADSAFEDSFLKSLAFQMEDIKDAKITSQDGLLLTAELKNTSGKTVKLISFADVGRGGSGYQSWLRVDGDFEQLVFKEGERPVWCSGMTALNHEPEIPDVGGSNGGAEPSDPGDNPNTGEIANAILIALAVCGVSGGVIATLLTVRKKRSRT